MIPKIIHYCWFGGNEKPEIVKSCLNSWLKFCPNWEIHEWNESNFDVTNVPYMKEAYEQKKWAFVSDVARLIVVYQHGGIYLDTDVELLDTLDNWINYDAFYAFESNRNINSGIGFGAVKGHHSVKAMLDWYTDRHFIVNGKPNMTPCPAINTEALQSTYKDMVRNGRTQHLDALCILSVQDYAKTAKHHGAATWVDGYTPPRKSYKDTFLKKILRSYKAFSFVEKFLGQRGAKIYTFLVYDFLELGIAYYIKRFFKKQK